MIDLAAKQARNLEGNQHSRYKTLLLNRKQRVVAYYLKRILGKSNLGALDKVLIIQEEEKIELIAKEDIENAYHNKNSKKFAQTAATPAMSGQLCKELGYLGNLLVCRKILEGIYKPLENVDYFIKELLKEIHKLSSIINLL